MKKRTPAANAADSILKGYLFLHLNLNLGTLNVLPNWVGYLFINEILPDLALTRPSALLLRPLGWGLAAWEGVCWVLTLFSITPTGLLGTSIWQLAQVAAGVAGLYFHFQLLTDLAETARMKGYPSVKKLLRLRTVKTLLSTFVLGVGLPPASQLMPQWMIYWVIGVSVVATIWICLTLNDLSLYLDNLEPPEEIPAAT